MKFRVTYWPGTDKLRSCCVKEMEKSGELDRIARHYTTEASSWDDAQRGSLYLMYDSVNGAREASDGCLIEYINTCTVCSGTFYTNRDAGRQEMCPNCEHDLTLA